MKYMCMVKYVDADGNYKVPTGGITIPVNRTDLPGTPPVEISNKLAKSL